MKMIANLTGEIKEELHGAKKYIKAAVHYKDEYPQLSASYAEMADQKLNHAMKLHGHVVKMIEEQRKVEEPPAYMLARWKEEHDHIMGKVAKVKALMGMYRERAV